MLRTPSGMTKADVSIKVVGNSPGVLQFIRQGRIGVSIKFGRGSGLRPADCRRSDRGNWPTDRYAPLPSQIYVTTRDLIEKKPATVVSFLRALKVSTGDMMQGDLKAIYHRAGNDFDIPGIRNLDELTALYAIHNG